MFCKKKEVWAVEEEARQVMSQQGSWIQWDSVQGRSLSWKDIWNMEGNRIKFLLSSIYDVLPRPTNLHRWRLADEPSCAVQETSQPGTHCGILPSKAGWHMAPRPGTSTTSPGSGVGEEVE